MDPENFTSPRWNGAGSCGDLFGRTAPLLRQASNRARRAKTRRLRKINRSKNYNENESLKIKTKFSTKSGSQNLKILSPDPQKNKDPIEKGVE